jgi:Tfp pilus assembly protein PilF
MNTQSNSVRLGLRVAIAGWFAVSAAHLAAPLRASDQILDEIRVVEVQGVVEVSPAGADTWVLTQTNQALHAADRLRTGANSRAALRWSDKSVMQLGPLTELEILPHPSDEEPGLHLLQGVLSFFHRDKPGRIRIITRGVTAGIDGTEFVLEETGAGDAERTVLSVIDGQVRLTNALAALTVTNGEQAVAVPGRAPELRRGFIANNLLQWCFYFPAVLDPNDLPLSAGEEAAFAPSLAAYRAGDVVGALARYPANAASPSDNARVYRAALLLAVGEAVGAEEMIGKLSGHDASSRARRLGNALRLLIAAVKRQPAPAGIAPELPTELLAASYYEQSLGKGDESLNNALGLAEKAAARSPGFSFAWERVAELDFGFGRTGEARAALRKSLVLAPRNAQAVALDGFLSSAQNHIRDALAAFDRAITLDGALGNAWLGRGLCRIKLGQGRAGREDLLIAAALEPQRALLRSYLGKAFADSGDDARAAKELALARALDPNDPTAWLYSALLKQQENQINPAISDLQTAQTNNDNRSVFRSRLLLDEDRAVASANLASIYRDAGMTDVSVREAARAVTDDYANDSAHLFLADSYYDLLDPTQFNLRYDTAWFNELLLANTLAPVGAGRLSQQVSQQDYSKLFESDGPGMAGSSDARTDGMYHETASQFGTYGNTSYGLDLDYYHNTGVRINNGLDNLNLDATLKQQVTPQDTAMLLVQFENYHSGDNFQYYYQTNARPFYKFDEEEQPELAGTWHHEWAPGIHTLLLLDRLVDHQTFSDKAAPQLLFAQLPRGPINAALSVPFDVNYQEKFEVYGAELNQICQWDRVTLVAGGRYQSGEFQTQDQLGNPGADAFLFTKLGSATPLTYSANTTGLFQRVTGYSYLTVEPLDHLWLTGGVAADDEKFPYYFRNPPVTSGEDTHSQLGPKAALVWSPIPEATLRGIYTRSLGGVSIDESYRLEPTELAGFPQAFRSLISESVVGSQSVPTFETLGGALDLKLGSRTYFGMQLERLGSEVNEGIGDFLLQNGGVPAVASSTPEQLDYVEHAGSVSLNQLIDDDFVLGIAYKITQSHLHEVLPNIPVSALTSANQTLTATLQEIDTCLLFNHPSGFYARFEAHWYGQNNGGWTPVEPDVSFVQENIFAGYRFAHRRAELQLGILNLSGGGYDLNPLTVYQELPRKRVFEASFNFIF